MALGLGSNLIVRDGGVPGVVVRLGKPFAKIDRIDETTLRCGGGASGILVSSTARDAGIAGLEFLRGIPGTVGGFVRMNGGAYGREVSDILVSARLVLRSGEVVEWPLDKLGYTYRHSEVPAGAVVVEAVFRGTPGDPASDRRGDGRHRSRSRGIAAAAQPHRRLDLQKPAGPQGLGAGRRGGMPRTDDGRRPSLGKALQFLLNLGSATSAEIEALGEEVRRRVEAKTHISLEWEIQRVGQRMNKDLHVVVLMGGWSSEREVSLTSGKGVAAALRERGWSNVTELDMDRDVAARLAELKPDVVFNALHGTPGEDGTVQGMMDLMGVTYTHSGLETSVIAIDKELTKMVLVPHGIRMPAGKVVSSESLTRKTRSPGPMS